MLQFDLYRFRVLGRERTRFASKPSKRRTQEASARIPTQTASFAQPSSHRYTLYSIIPLLPSYRTTLSAVEWGSDRSETTISAKATSFSRLAGNPAQGVLGGKMAHSLRSLGSAALNYGMVAQGSLDLYWYVLPALSSCSRFEDTAA